MAQEDGTLRSVMIIDDDLGYAESLADLLQLKGYRVLYVDRPEQAIAVLRDPPDGGARAPVALVDVRLGGIESGVDLIPRLRAEHPELICVLMTTGIDSQTAIAASIAASTALRCSATASRTKRCASPRKRPRRRTVPSRVFSRR